MRRRSPWCASVFPRCTADRHRCVSRLPTRATRKRAWRSPLSVPTAIIAEDEAVLRDELRARLAVLWPELAIVAEAADGFEATRAFEAHTPDILFLDIQMPGMTGLEVAQLASGR